MVLIFCACSELSQPSQTESGPESNPSSQLGNEQKKDEGDTDSITDEVTPDLDNANPTVFTAKEVLNFEQLRADWTKEQMEEHGFEKQVNGPGGETTYSDGRIRYVYFDFYDAPTPAIVDVYGDIPGPRGIKVGDAFEEVLALFPQEVDWEINPFGTLYGNFDPDAEEETKALSAYVTTYENRKEITLLTEKVLPSLRIFFEDGKLTHYSFFLISAS